MKSIAFTVPKNMPHCNELYQAQPSIFYVALKLSNLNIENRPFVYHGHRFAKPARFSAVTADLFFHMSDIATPLIANLLESDLVTNDVIDIDYLERMMDGFLSFLFCETRELYIFQFDTMRHVCKIDDVTRVKNKFRGRGEGEGGANVFAYDC